MRLANSGAAPSPMFPPAGELGVGDVIEIDEPVSPGTVLGGRYVVGNVLAEGGMGIVYLGRHRGLGHLVAIKFLRRDICDRPSIVERFLNEAKATASLRSDHVVRVLDVGQLQNGRPYLVMEHLEGEDLERRVERDGPLCTDVAIEFILEACSALAEAHAKGIVHRDIKPENLFLAYAGVGGPSIKVVDFGLAKRIDAARKKGMTGPRENMGSPCFMSPEQITTPHEVDVRTDVWSLGVTLYRLLTGAVPFEGDTMSEVYAHILNTEPKPIYAIRRGLDSDLDAIVRRCLEKNAERRYQSVTDLTRDLIGYRRRHRGASSMVATGGAITGWHRDDSPVNLPLNGPRSRTLVALFVAAVAAVVLYEADHTGRIDVRALAGRAVEPVLAIGPVRRMVDLWSPKLEALPDEPGRRPELERLVRVPYGVCASSSVFDSSGRTIASEPEHGREDESVELGTGDD